MEHTNLYTCLYARRSNEDDKDGESIENQVSLLKQYCAKEGYLNIKVFTDDGYTGTNFNRPDFQKMFALIKHRHVKRVIVKDLSRFGRNNLEVSRYLGVEFPRYDVEFVSIIDGPGSSDPDNIVTQVKNMMNEFYAKDISDKQKHSLIARSNNGQHIAPTPPFGYKIDPENRHHWIIDEDAAITVRMIFDLYLNQMSLAEIAKELEKNKRLAPSAHTGVLIKNSRTENNPYYWCASSVLAVIKRQDYCGDTINFKSYQKSFKDKQTCYHKEEDYVIIRDTQDAIISREDFEKARERRLASKRIKSQPVDHILDSVVFCGDCGARMYINKKRNKSIGNRFVYYCNSYRKSNTCTSHYIQEKTLTDLVLDKLFTLFAMYNADKKVFRKMLTKGINSANENTIKKIKDRNLEITNKIHQLRTKESNLHDDYHNELISLKTFININTKIDLEIEQLEEEQGENFMILDEFDDKKSSIKPFMQKFAVYSNHQKDEIDKFIISQFINRIDVYETISTLPNGKTDSKIDIKITFEGIGYINIEEL